METETLIYLFIDKSGEPYLALTAQHPFEEFDQLYRFKMPNSWWRYLRRVYKDISSERPEERPHLLRLVENFEAALEGFGEKGAWLGSIEICSTDAALLTFLDENYGQRKQQINIHEYSFWFSLAQMIRDEFSGERGGDDWLSFPYTDAALNNKIRYYSARTSWGYIALKTYLCLKETDPEYFKLRFPAEAEQILENLKTLPSVAEMRESLVFDLYHRPLTKTELLPVSFSPDLPHTTATQVVVNFLGHTSVEYYFCGPEKGLVLSIDGEPVEGMRVRFIPGENELFKTVEVEHSST